jgi:hypothetical protein
MATTRCSNERHDTMITTFHDSDMAGSEHPSLYTFAAWLVCLTGLGLTTAAAFRTVESFTRPVFEKAVPRSGSRHPGGIIGTDEAIARIGTFLWPVEVADGVVIRQEFDVHRDGLAGINLKTVTWHETPAAHGIRWSLQELSGPEWQTRSVVRSGTLDPTEADDWGYAEIRFPPIPATAGGRFALKLTADDGRPAKVMGLPLFEALEPHEPPVVRHRSAGGAINDSHREDGAAVVREIPANAVLDVLLIHAAGGS